MERLIDRLQPKNQSEKDSTTTNNNSFKKNKKDNNLVDKVAFSLYVFIFIFTT